MKKRKLNLKNRTLKCVLALVLLVMLVPTLRVEAASYASDYRYWSQGGSDDSDMRAYGCWVVAQAKMLYEANVNRSSSFNPDVYLQWERNNGYINSQFYQVNGATAPVAYANAVGKNLNYLGYWNADDSQLWFNINAGYYTILYVSGTNTAGSHYVLMANELSKSTGQLYCYDSFTTTGTANPQLISRYSIHNGGYVYSANNPETALPGKVAISAKSTYYTSEDITFSWNTPANATKYGITVYTRPASGSRVMVFDLPSLTTAHKYNLGKYQAGDYRLWMRAYNSDGTGGDATYVDFTVKAHTHSYTSKVTKKATCTTDGVKIYTCSCGASYTEKIAKTGHEAVTDKAVAATCTKEGKTEGSHCSACGTVIKAQKTIAKTGHKEVTDKAVAATCTKEGKTKGSHCSACGTVIKAQQTIAKKAHSYEQTSVTRATTKEDGKIYYKCKNCTTTMSKSFAKIKEIKLSETNFTYNGWTRKPSVTVKDNNGNKLKKGTDYTISYEKNSKAIGQYKVTVKFKGKYSGSVKKTYTISPKGTKLTGYIVKSKSQVQISWKKQSSKTDGYEIQYSTSSSYKKNATKTIVVKKNSATKATIKSLKQNKKYYVRIRTYKNVKQNGKTVKVYSGWSKTMGLSYTY